MATPFPDKSQLTQQQRLAAIQAVRKWIPLDERFPAPGEYVLVKMDDGLIEVAHWDSARASWSHNPFERWGRPEFWAPLTPDLPPTPQIAAARHLPISGTPPSRVRPDRASGFFGLKFLSSLLQ
jgi:hypothetical protein